MVPCAETVRRLEIALGFHHGYLALDEVDAPSVDAVSFRSLSKMSARARGAAIAAGTSAIELASWLSDRFVLPEPSLPDLQMSPAEAALQVRAEWGLGERPVRNMLHLLESRGVRVFSLVDQCRTVNAFSFWREDTPFVFLSTDYSSERSRFDAAHELGHLVLHRNGAPQGREAERDADAFASEFLMPHGDVLAQIPANPSLQLLVRRKSRWGVAVSALAYRSHKLSLSSEWHYRQLMIDISRRGWRKAEPAGRARETSQVLSKVFAALRDEGLSATCVAEQLGWMPTDLTELVFGLALVSIDGGGQNEGTHSDSERRAHLRLVSSQNE